MASLFDRAATLFGFEIKRDNSKEDLPTVAPKIDEDGAVVIGHSSGTAIGQTLDLEGSIQSEAALVNKYRDMSLFPEVDLAINTIVDEAIVWEEGKKTVELILDDVKVPENVKKVILEEFNYLLKLFEFNTRQYDVFRRWYVDGRLYYYVMIDPKNPADGIQELRFLDPRMIRKVRQVSKKRDKTNSAVAVPKTVAEYYVYSDKSFVKNKSLIQGGTSTTGVKIAKDSVIHCTSGLTDQSGTTVIGYLHKAIKPLNSLRALEDAVVIYALARAPERRVIYVDVGNLPKMKADQLIREVANKHKNKLVYDSSSGEIRDDRRFLTMVEDYYLGRREGGKGTEITTLQGGQMLSQMSENVQYFLDKVYRSLNVPITRVKPEESAFGMGRPTAITRDEISFAKFIDRLRLKFSVLFLKALEKQLILKNILTPEDWDEIQSDMRFRYLRDNFFAELKDSEILQDRLTQLDRMLPYIGRFYSNETVRKNVLKQNDDDIEKEDKLIADEANNPQYAQVATPMPDMGFTGSEAPDDTLPFDPKRETNEF